MEYPLLLTTGTYPRVPVPRYSKEYYRKINKEYHYDYPVSLMKLCLSVYGELYRIELESVLYFQADDHYTFVYYTSGTHFMMPFGLSKVEAAIAEVMTENNFLVRLSRKYIVNIMRVFHINVLKQVLVLNDDSGTNVSLHLPKQTLRLLIGMLDKPHSTRATESDYRELKAQKNNAL